MKTYARPIALAVALCIVGFFAAVGLMSVLFAPQADSFAPKNSADAAGWVQAIGSVVAILASYHLGSRQAAGAQRQEAERLKAQVAKQHSLGTLVQTSTEQVLHIMELMLRVAARPGVIDMFPAATNIANSALTVLRAIPMSDVDPPANMRHIAGIISTLEGMQDAMDDLHSKHRRCSERQDLTSEDVIRTMENHCFFFKHKLKYQAGNIHDHLSALGFPSSRTHPIYGAEEVEPADLQNSR